MEVCFKAFYIYSFLDVSYRKKKSNLKECKWNIYVMLSPSIREALQEQLQGFTERKLS